METKHNFQQQQITGRDSQTLIFDPKMTGETDEFNPDFQEAAQEMFKPRKKTIAGLKLARHPHPTHYK